MQRAIERSRSGEAFLIPLLVRPVDLKDTYFEQIQWMPRNGHPVSEWRSRSEAWVEIVSEIRYAIRGYHLATWVKEANRLLRLKLYEETLAAYQQVIQLSGIFCSASYFNVGNILYILGRYEEALDAYNKAIQEAQCIDSTPLNADIYKANIWHILSRYEGLPSIYDRIVQSRYSSFTNFIRFFKSAALEKIGQVEESKKVLEEAIEALHASYKHIIEVEGTWGP